MTFADAKQRFSNRVTDYVRYRPSYPSALLDLLRAECDLRPDRTIADIGSGTGLLTKLFLDNGNRVFGVEPNEEMRAASEQFLEAGREFRRILKPAGWVVVVWQDRRMEDTPFAKAYEELLERFGVDYKRVKDAYPEKEKIRTFFDSHSFRTRDLPNHQVFDWEGLCGRLRSSSFAPTENHANYAPMMVHLRKIFEQHHESGSVRMDYFARVYFGNLPVNTP